jgi:hypothetical protein
MKACFRQVDTEKPRSSRQESREVYLIGRGFSMPKRTLVGSQKVVIASEAKQSPRSN